MPLQTSLASLERQHQALEREIQQELAHPAADPLRLTELKRRKLILKDEIVRLRHESVATVH